MANKKAKPIVEPVLEENVVPVEEPALEEVKYVVVTADLLNVRKSPSTTSDILTVVSKDTKLYKTSTKLNKGFYSVVTPSGIEGYVMKEFVVEE